MNTLIEKYRLNKKGFIKDVLEEDLSQYIGRASLSIIQDDDSLEKEINRIVRQTALAEIGKRPEVSIIISRLS